MTEFNTCHFGDCRDSMRKLIADGVKVQCVVTSPPYWGLRDYGHEGQLGLEATPAEYIASMVETFGLVRELLADGGTLWLNIGDSYATGAGKVGEHPGGGEQGSRWAGRPARGATSTAGYRGGRNGHEGKHGYSEGARGIGPITQPNRMPQEGLKPKDLVGIPWMLAFALRADGWYLRSEIIWHKPNPMPESVKDRPTKAHEQIFLLTKSERYYYNHEAIKEPSSLDTHARYARGRSENHKWADGGPGDQTIAKSFAHMRNHAPTGSGTKNNPSFDPAMAFRNKRTVWTVASEPYSGAHFATFPTAIVEPCVLAGSRPADIVFDPFFGSGTVGQVSQSLGRRWIGCEINPEYAPLQRDRTSQMGLVMA